MNPKLLSDLFDLGENPFAVPGPLVAGKYFIGRSDLMAKIRSSTIESFAAGNVAIVGERRIGKSSLATQCLLENKAELNKRKIVPIWIDVGDYENQDQFFFDLASRCYEELDDLELLTPPIMKKWQVCESHKGADAHTVINDIKSFFTRARNEGIRVFFLLDEFDSIRFFFEKSGYKRMRALGNRDLGIRWVAITRRALTEYEKTDPEYSTLSGIFGEAIYLKGFDEKDMEEFFARLEFADVKLSVDDRYELSQKLGNHPFLLSIIAFELARHNGQDSVVSVLERTRQSIVDHFIGVIKYLRAEGTLGKLLQLHFGPVYDLQWMDVERLKRYGLIIETSEGYKGTSSLFAEYLAIESRSTQLWPLFGLTEQKLRKLVLAFLEESYQGDWYHKLKKDDGRWRKLEDIFLRLENDRQKEQQFGEASDNILDFSYPEDLKAIMSTHWRWFENVLGDRTDLQIRLKDMAALRNRLAHFREFTILEDRKKAAEAACNMILKRIEEWECSTS